MDNYNKRKNNIDNKENNILHKKTKIDTTNKLKRSLSTDNISNVNKLNKLINSTFISDDLNILNKLMNSSKISDNDYNEFYFLYYF